MVEAEKRLGLSALLLPCVSGYAFLFWREITARRGGRSGGECPPRRPSRRQHLWVVFGHWRLHALKRFAAERVRGWRPVGGSISTLRAHGCNAGGHSPAQEVGWGATLSLSFSFMYVVCWATQVHPDFAVGDRGMGLARPWLDPPALRKSAAESTPFRSSAFSLTNFHARVDALRVEGLVRGPA